MAALIATLLVALSAVPAAAARTVAEVDGISIAVTPQTTAATSPPPCQDTKYNLQGPKQKSTLRWSYKSSTTPLYLSTSGVVTVLKGAFSHITSERNDCGRADTVSATSSYLGTTTRAIGVTKSGTCGAADGYNTIGFGTLPSGYLALTCVRSVGTTIVETDMRISSSLPWALSLAGCFNAFMLAAVTTHEVGHMYGMAHVGENYHGRLTMSTYIDGTCENGESTLGLGDMKGLEALY